MNTDNNLVTSRPGCNRQRRLCPLVSKRLSDCPQNIVQLVRFQIDHPFERNLVVLPVAVVAYKGPAKIEPKELKIIKLLQLLDERQLVRLFPERASFSRPRCFLSAEESDTRAIRANPAELLQL